MSERFERLKTALADRYVIERELGRGGMATVFLAHDTKHQRQVALKVLLPELAAVLGAERFLNEIRVTANLQHPNIVALYDSGEADGDLYYVMPYIEGESLGTRLARERQLPIDEAVAITRTVAGALDYAHRRNVIHRDIKPDNILLQDGNPMVADFGIALAVANVAGDRITATGLSLGTPSYMSPEQATGDRIVTPHADVYALASVLYEMIAGDPPFTGSNVQAVIAKVVGEKPVRLSVIRDTVPPNVEAAVEKALAKVPADRFSTTKAFADALVAEKPVAVVGDRGRARWVGPARIGVPVAAAALIAWAVLANGNDSTAEAFSGSTISRVTGFAGWEMSPSWSPDGSQIAYGHAGGGDADVATLSLGGGEPHILTGNSPYDDINPRWSPDGSKIAFISDRGNGSNIYWIPPTGGAERLIAETDIRFLEHQHIWFCIMGTNPWSPDSDRLVFSRLNASGDVGLWEVRLSTGEQTQLTVPPPGATDEWPSWSPDGSKIFYQRLQEGVMTVWEVPATGGEPSLVLGNGTEWFPALFPDNERLVATSLGRAGAPSIWEFDLASLEPRQRTSGGAGFQWTPVVGPRDVIAYDQFDHEVDLYWLGMENLSQPTRLTFLTGDNFGARVSPDGTQILWTHGPPYDLWVLDRTTNQTRQLTSDPPERPGAADRMGDWSPTGDEIVFLSDRGGVVQLWIADVNTGIARRVTDHAVPWNYHMGDAQTAPRWSPDGSVIAYRAPAPGREGEGIWLVNPDGSDRRPSAIADATSFGWYRDGQRLIYTRHVPDGSGRAELRAVHLGTGEDVVLRSEPLAEVAVSPDGTALTFISSVSHFTMDMYLLRLAPPADASGLPTAVGEPEQITFGNGEWHVHSGGWAWDGSGFVYSRDRDYGDIYVIEPNR